MTTERTDTNQSWVPLLTTGTQGNKEITRNDLDSIAAKFSASGTSKMPVVFGKASGNGPVLAQVNGMRREGDTLSARLTNIDPRMDRLVKAGLLRKRSLQIKGHGMPEGPSITGIGLVQRRMGAGSTWQDTPGTEEELNKLCNTSGDLVAESQFADRSTPGTRVSFVESATENSGRSLFGRSGERLTTLAKQRAEQESISFGDALSQVAVENPELAVSPSQQRERLQRGTRPFDKNGELLTALARQRAELQAISFGEALAQVAMERLELTVPDMEFREIEPVEFHEKAR